MLMNTTSCWNMSWPRAIPQNVLMNSSALCVHNSSVNIRRVYTTNLRTGLTPGTKIKWPTPRTGTRSHEHSGIPVPIHMSIQRSWYPFTRAFRDPGSRSHEHSGIPVPIHMSIQRSRFRDPFTRSPVPVHTSIQGSRSSLSVLWFPDAM